MSALNSPAVPVKSTVPAMDSPSGQSEDSEGLMSLFERAESKLDMVLGKTTAQRMQRAGFLAAVVAVAGAVIAYRRMQK